MELERWGKEIWPYLPGEIRGFLQPVLEKMHKSIYEIRIRLKRPLALESPYGTLFISAGGTYGTLPQEGVIMERPVLDKIFQLLSQCSVYAFEEELRQGYLTIPGGHRIGFVGKAVLDKGSIKALRSLAGYNYRICRQLNGVADRVLKYILGPDQSVYHTLIISPPGMGKTTLLREIARRISNGVPELNFGGLNVGVVDERSELAGCFMGEPQLDLGVRTDILDGCPKRDGMLMLLRSMGPAVIVTDELGTERDLEALEAVLNAGVKVMTTVHAGGLSDLAGRPGWRNILHRAVFERVIQLSRRHGVFYAEVTDCAKGQKLTNMPLILGGGGNRENQAIG